MARSAAFLALEMPQWSMLISRISGARAAKRGNDLAGAIGRAIIDDDDVELARVALAQEGIFSAEPMVASAL